MLVQQHLVSHSFSYHHFHRSWVSTYILLHLLPKTQDKLRGTSYSSSTHTLHCMWLTTRACAVDSIGFSFLLFCFDSNPQLGFSPKTAAARKLIFYSRFFFCFFASHANRLRLSHYDFITEDVAAAVCAHFPHSIVFFGLYTNMCAICLHFQLILFFFFFLCFFFVLCV